MISQHNFPTPIRFGSGAINELVEQLAAKQAQRPLIVTDAQVAKLDFFESKICQPLKLSGIECQVYSDFSGNPIKSHVDQGVSSYHNHNADSVVMIGGGAALDVGKAIALLAVHPGDLFDYEDGKEDGRPANNPLPFMIAIPTTAGTGSEVGRSSVISDNETKAKRSFLPLRCCPIWFSLIQS